MPRSMLRLSLAVKLPLIFLSLTLLAAVTVGFAAYRDARSELMQAAKMRLAAVADSRVEAMLANFDRFVSEIHARATDPVLYRAVFDLERGFEDLKTQGDPVELLRKAYITDNPFPIGEKYKYESDANFWKYNVVHKNIHSSLSPLVVQRSFYDVFLIAMDGDVVYSVAKERDFASNVLTGEWKDSALAKVARQALETNEDGAVFFSDFEHYAPSADAPAAFAATPIYNAQHVKVGALAVQISSDPADAIMQRRAGLGENGMSVLIGEDGFLRSNTSTDSNDLLVRKLDLPVMSEITSNKAEAHVTPGFDGKPSVVAVSPVKTAGLTYYVVAQEPLDDILVPVRNLEFRMVRDGGIVLLIVAAICALVARSIVRPVRAAATATTEIGRKNYAIDIAGLGRRDELGDMARSLAEVRDVLSAGAAAARESAFKSSAFEGASAALMMVDRDFRLLHVNPAAKALMLRLQDTIKRINPTFDPDRMIGASIDIFHAVPDTVKKRLSTPGALPLATEIKLGDTRIALNIAEVVLDGEGPLGLVVEWKDVTAEQMNRSILDAIDKAQLTALFDPLGKVVTANANLQSVLGSNMQSYATASDLIALADGGELATQWQRIAAGEAANGRYSITAAHGGRIIVDGGFTPIADRAGKVMRVSFMATDVTVAEESLKRAEAARTEMEAAQRHVVAALTDALRALALGDLTVSIDTVFGPDHEGLRENFNASVRQLAGAMAAVVENAQSIQGEVREISNAADDLSRRTEKQAATLEETAAALDQLTSSVQSAADGAAEANRVVEDARKSAEVSGTVVQETVSAMHEISSSSDRISKIIGVIDDIAFQTNLLALNAGVEAARAGEAGRGFAVVASEVRALAQRSSDAAREINDLISASSAQVRRGVGLVGQAGDALRGIVQSVNNIAIRVSDIAASAKEQSVGLAEINTAVNQLDQVTQQNVAMFEETSAASHALAREADALSATTAQFQVPDIHVATPSRAKAAARTPAPARPVPATPVRRTNGALAEASLHEDWHEF